MPYSPEHKQRSRERILESAYRLFITRGYAHTTIDEVMAEAGLTRGAFYAHFANKDDLYQAAIQHAANTSYVAAQRPDGMSEVQWLSRLLKLYLSDAHVAFKGRPCPLASLVTDMTIRDAGVRKSYTESFKGFNRIINQALGKSEVRNATTLAVSAMMVGAVAIARAVQDTSLRRELLASCQHLAVDLLELEGIRVE
ncbi:MAG: TetR/AcrR family transcriptional regulator [Gammaproteobacteria bacterium]|nr:TetR/AcrR family transcriptional regulator [Gammaproteobacteria bacterium]